jgi:capsule polysaccharide export protein KpsE/RkpR
VTTEPSGHEWGRVGDDGTVFVRTSDGERSVGQYPEGTPEEALKFYTDRYDALAFEVELLDQRIKSGVMSPEEAAESVRTVRSQVVDANAVGDLAALVERLDSFGTLIGEQRELRKAERAQKQAEAKAVKERIVGEAEKLAAGNDWRNGANRLRELLDEWKALPRIDRSSDDALWRRFSTARTSYTKARKSHFAEQHEKREGARSVKERLVKDAEALTGSTDWGPTSGEYRELMRRWKAAGPAPRDIDEELWKRFRAAQDSFFAARDAANAAQDAEFAANAEVKDKLLVEAEALVPVTDLDAAKTAFREISDGWDAAGKVPRERIRDLEARIRKVEQAIRAVEEEQWRRTDPEKSARADDMVTKLEDAIAKIEADLAKARAAGDERKSKELADNLESRQAFLEMARRAASDYSG